MLHKKNFVCAFSKHQRRRYAVFAGTDRYRRPRRLRQAATSVVQQSEHFFSVLLCRGALVIYQRQRDLDTGTERTCSRRSIRSGEYNAVWYVITTSKRP